MTTSVDDHLKYVLATVRPLATAERPVLECLGLVPASDVIAPVSLPSFDNSSMDGYAVRVSDITAASPDEPALLPVAGELAAGTIVDHELAPGTTLQIMTGAPIPAGCDAVIPFEVTDRGTRTVAIHAMPKPGDNIRRAGGDVTAGDTIFHAGAVIDARRIGLLASVGISALAVRRRPRVAIISTGTELVEPGRPLASGQIYDGNSFMLAAAAIAAGATAYRVPATADDPDAFARTIRDQIGRADVIVTSGGVSKGNHDVVKAALSSLDSMRFYEVAMQPGKPQGFGTYGDAQTPIFTLPGNSVASYISFELFVVPALRKLTGRTYGARPQVIATLETAVSSMPGRRQYLRGHLDESRTGALSVKPVGGYESHLVGSLAHSNALIVIDEATTIIDAGAEVPVIRLEGPR